MHKTSIETPPQSPFARALSGWVRVPVLRTRLSIFNANAPAKRVPQVHEVGDDYAFAFLRRQFLRQQGVGALDAGSASCRMLGAIMRRLCPDGGYCQDAAGCVEAHHHEASLNHAI